MKLHPVSIFFCYIREHLKGILLFLLPIAIFALLFSLYNLPREAILYAASLSLLTALAAFCVDFSRYYRHHQAMLEAQEEIRLGIDRMPTGRSLTERDLLAIAQAFREEKTRAVSEQDRTRTEMVDYYTMWAHQIKTPIAAMALLLQSEELEQTEQLREELLKIEQYVEMVLSYLRLDSSSNDLVIQEYDLDGIIRQAVRKYAPLFIRKKIALHYEPLRRTVLTDEKWLLFVIEQLLSNALKYTPAGKSVSIYMEDAAPGTLVIADTGIGIAPEDLPRVFEKGFTGYNGRQEKKSTGIGLYLCRRVMQRLSHLIRIESEPEAGTRVLLDLAHVPLEIE